MLLVQAPSKDTALYDSLDSHLIGTLGSPADESIADFLPLVCWIDCEDVERYEISRCANFGLIAVGDKFGNQSFGKFLC